LAIDCSSVFGFRNEILLRFAFRTIDFVEMSRKRGFFIGVAGYAFA
jgi:hypothetical protein